MATPAEFVCHQAELIAKERTLELDTTAELLRSWSPLHLQRLGLALVGLRITGLRTGLGGKTLVDLEAPHSSGRSTLPTHQLRPGDIVSLQAYHAGQADKGAAKKAPKVRKGGANASSAIPSPSSPSLSAVIYRSTDAKLIVSTTDDIPDDWNERCTVQKLANDVTFKRMLMALATLMQRSNIRGRDQLVSSPTPSTVVNALQSGPSYPGDVSSTLCEALLGTRVPTFTLCDGTVRLVTDMTNITLLPLAEPAAWHDDTLNDSQRAAVRFALAANDVALVHGPPGTGKTFTLVEIIRQLVATTPNTFRILVCGPSNISVDNLVERLGRCRIPLVRLGHPARVLPTVLNHCLDVAMKHSEQGHLLKDVQSDMDRTLAQIAKTKRRGEKYALYQELKELRKELKIREKKVVQDCLQSSRVVLTTLNGAGIPYLDRHRFDVVVIDEATQALEGECWIAALKGNKLILAGDHLQLPPTIKSRSTIVALPALEPSTVMRSVSTAPTLAPLSTTMGLDTTLFDRMLALYGASIKRMLTVQYRMHQHIMHHSSTLLYHGQLTAHPSVANHCLAELPGVKDTEATRAPLIVIDTAGCNYSEQTEQGATADKPSSTSSSSTRGTRAWSIQALLDSDSKYNPEEAELVRKHMTLLVDEGGVAPEDIAIISPYNAQVRLLTSMLRDEYPGVEIGSVDGFQGREKEAIILSLVRSNDQGEIGFLADFRRLNVAITRPKRQLCVIGDSDTLGQTNVFLKKLFEWIEQEGEVHCAEYY
ncbi:hypothetical protein H4R35_002349 [Dimargaris xerosporica]|nr:hypothetical protein H4R35_002349 [Dimargaris xerosporica]